MPIAASVVAVGTSATLLALGSSDTHDLSQVIVRNDSGTTIFLGGATVSTASGLALPTATAYTVDLSYNDSLYGIVAAATQPIQVFRTRT